MRRAISGQAADADAAPKWYFRRHEWLRHLGAARYDATAPRSKCVTAVIGDTKGLLREAMSAFGTNSTSLIIRPELLVLCATIARCKSSQRRAHVARLPR